MEKTKEREFYIRPGVLWPPVIAMAIAFIGAMAGEYLGAGWWVSVGCMTAGMVCLVLGCVAYIDLLDRDLDALRDEVGVVWRFYDERKKARQSPGSQ